MFRFFLALALTASPSFAQEFQTRPSDTGLDATTLSAMILGRELQFFDGGRSRYAAGGSYSWTYSPQNGGASWYGTHQMSDDGIICIAFRHLRGRCDKFVLSGERLVLLTEDGARYPVETIR